jgi:phage gp16-like protein
LTWIGEIYAKNGFFNKKCKKMQKKTQKKRKKNAKKRAKIPGKISGKSPEKWKKVSKVSNFWGVPAPTAKGGWTPLFLGAHPTTTT